jgi:hypothetical protein
MSRPALLLHVLGLCAKGTHLWYGISMELKDDRLSVRVPSALKSELVELAQTEGRSLANLVVLLLRQALAQRGSKK